MAKIEIINNGIVLYYNKNTYSFPLNSLIIDASNQGDTVNFRLKGGGSRSIASISYKDFEDISASSANELVTELNKIIYV